MIETGTKVRYSKQVWRVVELSPGLAVIENEYDMKVVPLTSLREVKK